MSSNCQNVSIKSPPQMTSKNFLDSKQFEVFSKIADEDFWNPKGHMGPLQQFNEVRVPFICENLQKIGKITDAKDINALEGLRILDIGCGGGVLSEALAKLGAIVVGIEPVEKLCENARNHLRAQPKISKNVTYFCETIEEHCVKNCESYDVVIASEVIEHVEDKDSFIRSMMSTLKTDGDVFVSCPNKTIFSLILVHIIFTLILNIIPRESHKFGWFIHHKTLKRKLEKYGMVLNDLKGIGYIPFLIKWLLISFTGCWYISHFTRNVRKNL